MIAQLAEIDFHWLDKYGTWLRIAVIVAATIAAIVLVRALGRFIIRKTERADKRDEEEKTKLPHITLSARGRTLVKVFNNTLSVAILILGLYIVLAELNVNIAPLLAGAGIVGLAIGFGAQSLVKDFFTGFFILLENQYRIGDIVEIGDFSGTVEKITLRITVLRDVEGKAHFIPNGEIKTVSNMTYGFSRAKIVVSVAYKENIDRVFEIIRKVFNEMQQSPQFKDDIIEEPQIRGVEKLAESGVEIGVLFKTNPTKQWGIAREFRKRIKEAFDAEGIEIPFPHLKVMQHTPTQT